jgi:uncharacterized phage protein gp47/JayE
MPFERPTLPTLIERAVADIEARLKPKNPTVDARLRRSNLNVLARVHAGAVHGQYGYLDWIARQVIYDTAEAEILERWASIWGVTRKAAAQAKGNVTFTGNNGTAIPLGTVLVRSDGAEVTTDAEVVIAAGTALAAVTAKLGGAAGNTDLNTKLALSTPISGVNSEATVAAGGLSQGTDKESDASLLDRLLSRIKAPPHGGAANDYVTWAKEVAGVTRAWEFANELGLGTVTVRFVRDDDAGGLIPDAGEIAAVQTYIDERRPVTCAVTVVAPVSVPLAFTFSALDPNTQTVKDAITAELKDLLLRDAKPGGTILLSHVREAISLAAGENNFTLTAPNADVAHATGQLATLGVVTWP